MTAENAKPAGAAVDEPARVDASLSASVPASDALELCARLWSVCTNRRYEPGKSRDNPEFVAFLQQKGAQTPSITLLFDVEFYSHQVSWQSPDINYMLHYCENFRSGHLTSHVLLDNRFLLAQSGRARFEVPPLLQFLESRDSTLSPHPLFDSAYYTHAVGAEFLAGELPIIAFIERWAAKPARFSPYFSVPFYGLHEPIVRFGGLNPLIHFLSTPSEMRRDPNPMLHRGWYSSTVEDEIGEDEPLVHYILHGLPRGLMPNPFASGELRAASLGLPARVDALRRYMSFPDRPVTA